MFQDKRMQLVKMIKASQRLDSKPKYCIAERVLTRAEKEAEAFNDVLKLMNQHEEMGTQLVRF